MHISGEHSPRCPAQNKCVPWCSAASKGGSSPCSPVKNGLRVAPVPPPQEAALLTLPVRHCLLNLSGRRASRQNRRLRALPRGVEQRAMFHIVVQRQHETAEFNRPISLA